MTHGSVVEHGFTCPYCWELITMLLDTSAPAQTYIEDCEVCCNPIEISFATDSTSITHFGAEQV